MMQQARISKYQNKKTEYNGIIFDSRKEAKRYWELEMMQKAGEISDLQRQVRYEIIPKTALFKESVYIADFIYRDKKGNQIAEDVKGCRKGTAYEIFKLKKKLMYITHRIFVVEV